MKPSHPLEIFETRDDHVSWDKYEEQIDLIEELTEDEKLRAKGGMRYLRALLGEDFLRRGVVEGNPIFSWFFSNAAPHARRSLIRLAEELRSFENAAGFNGLIARLKNAEKAPEALSVLGAASSFALVGFIVSFDPRVKSTGKVPDLLLVDSNNGEEIYVEVSRLRRGGLQELNSHTYHMIFNEVLNAIWACANPDDITAPHVLPHVRILKSISLKELPEVIRRIREAIFETGTSNEYREIKIGNVVEMAVSPANDHSRAEAWASERDMRDLVEAPPIRLDQELRKATDKINKELDQLPADKPGIVTIPTSENMLFLVFDPRQIIIEIAEEARHHPNLLCSALSHTVMDGRHEPRVATLGDHAFVTRMNDLSTDRTAFVMNENFGLSLSASTIEKVRSAFLNI